jgi:DNA polymerase III epsilon subunit-like protein
MARAAAVEAAVAALNQSNPEGVQCCELQGIPSSTSTNVVCAHERRHADELVNFADFQKDASEFIGSDVAFAYSTNNVDFYFLAGVTTATNTMDMLGRLVGVRLQLCDLARAYGMATQQEKLHASLYDARLLGAIMCTAVGRAPAVVDRSTRTYSRAYSQASRARNKSKREEAAGAVGYSLECTSMQQPSHWRTDDESARRERNKRAAAVVESRDWSWINGNC